MKEYRTAILGMSVFLDGFSLYYIYAFMYKNLNRLLHIGYSCYCCIAFKLFLMKETVEALCNCPLL